MLEGAVELLGEGPGVDPNLLTNREKTILVNSLRPAHRLKDLLEELGMSRSSHRYQVAALNAPDKYADLRRMIDGIFADSEGRYGYCHVKIALGNEDVNVSEKVAARIMREDGLFAKRGKRRKYSSYKGGISEAPNNLAKCVFKADAPNKAVAHGHHRVQDSRRQGLPQPDRRLL